MTWYPSTDSVLRTLSVDGDHSNVRTTALTSKALILRSLAEEHRRVFADWRLQIHANRVARAERRDPPSNEQVARVLAELVRRRDAVPIRGVHGTYLIDTPFAKVITVSDEQIVQEANPYAVFSHLTALVHHGLTDQVPEKVWVTSYRPHSPRRLPLGTQPDEWVELDMPPGRLPRQVEGTSVVWTRSEAHYDFGDMVSHSHALPIYVTDPERTLLDALRAPGKCGGMLNVIRAWRRAAEGLDIRRLLDHADRFDKPILRQRVGYLLESMGLSHPRLDAWREQLVRGGSVKLLASADYSSCFNERWNLSLNVPEPVLAELQESS